MVYIDAASTIHAFIVLIGENGIDWCYLPPVKFLQAKIEKQNN